VTDTQGHLLHVKVHGANIHSMIFSQSDPLRQNEVKTYCDTLHSGIEKVAQRHALSQTERLTALGKKCSDSK
jgi:hypothetical protein